MIVRALRFLIVAALLGCIACGSNTDEVKIPESVLPKDSMVFVLVDLQLLEATIDLNLVSGAANPRQADKYFTILKKHHITRALYDTSLSFYSAHPELLAKIYDEVITELSKKQIELNKH